MHARIRHILAPEEFPHRLSAAPQPDAARIYAIVCENFRYQLFGRITVRHNSPAILFHPDRPASQILPHHIPVIVLKAFRKMYLSDHSWKYMTVFQMEIVVGTIKVGRHHGNIIRAVLKIEALAHLKPGNLGDSIRLISIFQRRCKQTVFRHRLRRILRVDACGAEKKQFFHSMPPAFTDYILLNLEITPDEVRPVLQVGHNASHVCRRKHYRIRPFLIKKSAYCGLVKKIKLLMGPSCQI